MLPFREIRFNGSISQYLQELRKRETDPLNGENQERVILHYGGCYEETLKQLFDFSKICPEENKRLKQRHDKRKVKPEDDCEKGHGYVDIYMDTQDHLLRNRGKWLLWRYDATTRKCSWSLIEDLNSSLIEDLKSSKTSISYTKTSDESEIVKKVGEICQRPFSGILQIRNEFSVMAKYTCCRHVKLFDWGRIFIDEVQCCQRYYWIAVVSLDQHDKQDKEEQETKLTEVERFISSIGLKNPCESKVEICLQLKEGTQPSFIHFQETPYHKDLQLRDYHCDSDYDSDNNNSSSSEDQ
jgi:hypothetical protein